MILPSIFVTDDEPACVAHVKALLTDEGYARVICHVGASAFHRIRDAQPDLVLLDINVRNPARGWATLDALRFHPQTRHIAVILCSTDMRLLEEKADVLREMHYQTLAKPCDSATLHDVVAAAIGAPPGRAQPA